MKNRVILGSLILTLTFVLPSMTWATGYFSDDRGRFYGQVYSYRGRSPSPPPQKRCLNMPEVDYKEAFPFVHGDGPIKPQVKPCPGTFDTTLPGSSDNKSEKRNPTSVDPTPPPSLEEKPEKERFLQAREQREPIQQAVSRKKKTVRFAEPLSSVDSTPSASLEERLGRKRSPQVTKQCAEPLSPVGPILRQLQQDRSKRAGFQPQAPEQHIFRTQSRRKGRSGHRFLSRVPQKGNLSPSVCSQNPFDVLDTDQGVEEDAPHRRAGGDGWFYGEQTGETLFTSRQGAVVSRGTRQAVARTPLPRQSLQERKGDPSPRVSGGSRDTQELPAVKKRSTKTAPKKKKREKKSESRRILEAGNKLMGRGNKKFDKQWSAQLKAFSKQASRRSQDEPIEFTSKQRKKLLKMIREEEERRLRSPEKRQESSDRFRDPFEFTRNQRSTPSQRAREGEKRYPKGMPERGRESSDRLGDPFGLALNRLFHGLGPRVSSRAYRPYY